MVKRLYSKRGEKALYKHSGRIINSTLSLLNKMIQTAEQETASKEDIQKALSACIELMPYLRPKMMAVAQGELSSDGDIVSPARYQALIEIARQAQVLPDTQVKPLLIETNTEGVTPDVQEQREEN